jgi:hypothetical protein
MPSAIRTNGPSGCRRRSVIALSKGDDRSMSDNRGVCKAILWPVVRSRPVPWFLFFAASIAAIAIACR